MPSPSALYSSVSLPSGAAAGTVRIQVPRLVYLNCRQPWDSTAIGARPVSYTLPRFAWSVKHGDGNGCVEGFRTCVIYVLFLRSSVFKFSWVSVCVNAFLHESLLRALTPPDTLIFLWVLFPMPSDIVPSPVLFYPFCGMTNIFFYSAFYSSKSPPCLPHNRWKSAHQISKRF